MNIYFTLIIHLLGVIPIIYDIFIIYRNHKKSRRNRITQKLVLNEIFLNILSIGIKFILIIILTSLHILQLYMNLSFHQKISFFQTIQISYSIIFLIMGLFILYTDIFNMGQTCKQFKFNFMIYFLYEAAVYFSLYYKKIDFICQSIMLSRMILVATLVMVLFFDRNHYYSRSFIFSQFAKYHKGSGSPTNFNESAMTNETNPDQITLIEIIEFKEGVRFDKTCILYTISFAYKKEKKTLQRSFREFHNLKRDLHVGNLFAFPPKKKKNELLSTKDLKLRLELLDQFLKQIVEQVNDTNFYLNKFLNIEQTVEEYIGYSKRKQSNIQNITSRDKNKNKNKLNSSLKKNPLPETIWEEENEFSGESDTKKNNQQKRSINQEKLFQIDCQ